MGWLCLQGCNWTRLENTGKEAGGGGLQFSKGQKNNPRNTEEAREKRTGMFWRQRVMRSLGTCRVTSPVSQTSPHFPHHSSQPHLKTTACTLDRTQVLGSATSPPTLGSSAALGAKAQGQRELPMGHWPKEDWNLALA